MRLGKLRPFVAAAVASAMMVALGCSDVGDGGEPDADVPTSVRVQTIQTRTVRRVLEYTGDVAPEVEVRVFSTIPDRIESLRAEEGQSVERGDILAIIRSTALGQGVRQALGGLASARARVAGLRETLTRQQRLLASGVVTQAQVDATRYQLEAAEAQVAQLEAAVGSAQTRRNDAIVRAPISGVIGQVFVEEGDMAAPQRPICTIVQMDRVEVLFQVPERELGWLRPGMEVEARIASVPGRVFRAPISRISPVLDRTSRTATVRVMLENPSHLIPPGSLADISIVVERHEGAVVVPEYALILDELDPNGNEPLYRAYVLNSDGRTVSERHVRVGIHEGDEVEVVEGLTGGERLVVDGQHLLHDGDVVRVVTGSERGAREDAGAEGGADAATSGGRS